MMRWITGILMAALVLAILFFAPQSVVQGIVVLVSLITLNEFFSLTLPHISLPLRISGLILGCFSTVFFIFFSKETDFVLVFLCALLMISFIIHLPGSKDFSSRLREVMMFYGGMMYMSLLFSIWGMIRALPDWQFWIFMMLGCAALSDIGGYLVGKQWGRHKLAPLISPGKTIEGLMGGLVFAVGGSFLIRFLFKSEFPILFLLITASLIALIGPLGDLSESMIKRGMGAKDSGNLIPGHGGLFDRVDAILFAGPVTYCCARLFSNFS